ncbi:anti-sigma F factor antagonist [Propionispora vibrioides]|uniref:Anti-sigma F factor antagonist n=1 Tax=Propionispora vibrioides TaxID=112903 RepID=A0A1H8P3G7_9FIRM|nr:anti-sigma F factor antagonist [Propionispora vibrioides]SEO36377.1 anti-anti-sigma regulatory factor, SpoIIAA [Propionispora vibrioides]
MKTTTVLKQGVLIVQIEGELDMHGADKFRETIDTALDACGAKNMILDLQDVSFIDSSGLGVILGRYKRLSALDGRILAVHVQPQVAHILELSGLLKIIEVYPSQTDALAQL